MKIQVEYRDGSFKVEGDVTEEERKAYFEPLRQAASAFYKTIEDIFEKGHFDANFRVNVGREDDDKTEDSDRE